MSVVNPLISEMGDVGQRKNGRSVEKNLSAVRFLWAILGGVQSGWEQFGAVKKWAVVIASRRVQLNALYLYWLVGWRQAAAVAVAGRGLGSGCA